MPAMSVPPIDPNALLCTFPSGFASSASAARISRDPGDRIARIADREAVASARRVYVHSLERGACEHVSDGLQMLLCNEEVGPACSLSCYHVRTRGGIHAGGEREVEDGDAMMHELYYELRNRVACCP